MKTLLNDSVEVSGYPSWMAYKDAEAQSEIYEQTYSDVQKQFAETLKGHAEDVWIRSIVRLNYRKTFITVKVDQPVNYRPDPVAIAKLDAWAIKRKVVIVKTRSAARIYRIPKEK